MEVALGILQALAIFLVGPVLVGLVMGGAFILRDHRVRARYGVGQLTCSADADCPPGYICSSYHCKNKMRSINFIMSLELF